MKSPEFFPGDEVVDIQFPQTEVLIVLNHKPGSDFVSCLDSATGACYDVPIERLEHV